MPTSIALRFGHFAFSSAISVITVNTAAPRVAVALTSADGSLTYFAETYYTLNGHAALHDFRSIVEQVMRQMQTQLATFRITATPQGLPDDAPEADAAPVSTDFTVLYCDRAVDTLLSPSDLIERQFLTSLPVRLASAYLPEVLHYVNPRRTYTNDPEVILPIYLHIHYLRLDTDERRVKFAVDGYTAPRNDGLSVATYSVDYADLSERVAEASHPTQVLGVTVDIGRRSATLLYPLHSPLSTLRFYFCNMFNVPEVAEIQAVTTAKQKVKTAEAVCDGSLRLYDHSVTQEYEVEADGLSLDRARWLAQMLASRDMRLIDRPMGEEDFLNENYPEILITDSTCELSDGDDELSKIKFTYRFAAERPLSGLAVADRIHTSQYKNPFN